MRAVWASIVVLVLAGCDNDRNRDGISDHKRDPTKVQLQGPSTPTGSLSGQLLDINGAGLQDVEVTGILSVPGEKPDTVQSQVTTNTDATGYWSLSTLPGGSSVELTFSKDGLGPLRIRATVPRQLAGHPVSDTNLFTGRWTILPLSGTLKFRVLDHTGRPAKGARATLDFSPTAFPHTIFGSIGGSTPAGNTVLVQATAGDDGVLTFSGIPAPEDVYRVLGIFTSSPRYLLTVDPLDENGDGLPDSGGVSITYGVANLVFGSASTTIQLPDARTGTSPGFDVLSSNIGSVASPTRLPPLENMLKGAEPIMVTFSHAIQPSSLEVRITDETGRQSISTGPPSISDGRILTIQPSSPWVAGREYNIHIHAVSLDTGTTLNRRGFFFGGDPGSPIVPKISQVAFRDVGDGLGGPPDGMLSNGEEVGVTFSEPVGYFGDLAIFPPSIVFFNTDLDNSGTIGDATGEINALDGFRLWSNEPSNETGTHFILRESGYTTRYQFFYVGRPLAPGSIDVELAFDLLTDSSSGLRSLWGQLITSREKRSFSQASQ